MSKEIKIPVGKVLSVGLGAAYVVASYAVGKTMVNDTQLKKLVKITAWTRIVGSVAVFGIGKLWEDERLDILVGPNGIRKTFSERVKRPKVDDENTCKVRRYDINEKDVVYVDQLNELMTRVDDLTSYIDRINNSILAKPIIENDDND